MILQVNLTHMNETFISWSYLFSPIYADTIYSMLKERKNSAFVKCPHNMTVLIFLASLAK